MTRPLRIGISAVLLDSRDGYRKAGIGRYVLRVLDELAIREDPHTYEVFVPEGAPLEPHWLDSRLRFHRVPFRNRFERVRWELTRPPGIVRELGLNVWFSLATGLPRRSPARRAVMIHDLVPLLYPQFFRRRKALYQAFALRYACLRADLILTNSEATRADIESRFPRAKGRVRVAPLGPGNLTEPVDPEQVDQEHLHRLGVPFPRYLFTLGTLEPRKNLQRLFEAMTHLDDPNLGLVVAGARGWRESGIVASLERMGIAGRVAFLGYVPDEDLPALFSRCEAFVFPSVYEGFGIPVLEAMLLGAPVLSSNHPALTEVGGEAASYFDPTDVNHIANCIRDFLATGDRYRMIQAGFARARRFTWRQTVDLTVKALEELGEQ